MIGALEPLAIMLGLVFGAVAPGLIYANRYNRRNDGDR